MIRTFNNVPRTVSLPDKSDVSNNYFNHTNWKGLNTDRNFLNTDQETFQDCKNVYVSEEGLLKSRPSLQYNKIAIKLGDNRVILSNILDVWIFDIVSVYLTTVNNKYYLTFVNTNFEDNLQVELIKDNKSYNKVKLLQSDEKIFVFSEVDFNYYDVKNNTYMNADEFIYIPTTTVTVNNVESSKTNVESENELTGSKIYKYIYDNSSASDFSKFIGKTVKITIDGVDYDINFKENNQLVFLGKYSGLSKTNFDTGGFIPDGVGHDNIPYIETCSNGTLLMSSYVPRMENNVPILDWNIYSTVDGVVYEKLPTISDIVGSPKLTKDGIYAVVFKNDGPYIYSVLNSKDGAKKYNKWTNLLETLDAVKYKQLIDGGFNLNEFTPAPSDLYFNQNVQINGYFFDDTIFAFTYAKSFKYVAKVPRYNDLNLFICRKNANDEVVFDDVTIFTGSSPVTPGQTSEYTPNVYLSIVDDKIKVSIIYVYDNGANSNYCISAVEVYEDNVYIGQIESLLKQPLTFIPVPLRSGNFISNGVYRIAIPYPKYDSTKPVGEQIGSNIDIITAKTKIPDNVIDDLIIEEKDTVNIVQYYDERQTNVENVKVVFSEPTGYLVTDRYLYDYSSFEDDVEYEGLSLLVKGLPLSYYYSGNVKDNLYFYDNEFLYTSDVPTVEITQLIKGKNNYLLPEHIAILENYYFSKDNTLYIGYTVSDNSKYKWYFPKINTQNFDYDITNLHPISNNEVSVFFDNEIYYVSYDNEIESYRYYKSKIQVGCKYGSDVITTFDGQYTIFASSRGLVAMSYRDFVANNEQTISYLSDNIYDVFVKYTDGPIKLYKFAFWILAYKNNSNKCYLFDTRNSSWWPLEIPDSLTKIYTDNDKVKILLKGNIHTLNTGDEDYYDNLYNVKSNVKWYIKSQKLHLGAINNYKHVCSMTFVSTHDYDLNNNVKNYCNSIDYELLVTNYRNCTSNGVQVDNVPKTINYNISHIKTFVQRLNYSKVIEFEYMLRNDDSYIDLPLSLNCINIKYKIGGQVR